MTKKQLYAIKCRAFQEIREVTKDKEIDDILKLYNDERNHLIDIQHTEDKDEYILCLERMQVLETRIVYDVMITHGYYTTNKDGFLAWAIHPGGG